MKTTSAQITTTPQESSLKQLGEEYFYTRLQQIWNKILLLEDTGIIENENEKFQYAYRFTEMEFQKICMECMSLQKRINEMVESE